MSWANVTGSMATWGGLAATDLARQFLTVGGIDQSGSVGFVLTVDESHPLTLSDTLVPYVLLQEVMVAP